MKILKFYLFFYKIHQKTYRPVAISIVPLIDLSFRSYYI